MLTATKVWDWVSVSAIAVLWYPLIQFILTLDSTYVWWFIGIWTTHFLTVVMKLWTYNTFRDAEWVKRPQGALNCDIMCRNGDRSGQPGFPSGHAGHAAFFCGFISAMAIHRKLQHKTLVVLAGCAYVLLTGIARHQKQCHNVEQILAGTLFGGVMGVVFYAIAAVSLKF